jgi:hypothetical protein
MSKVERMQRPPSYMEIYQSIEYVAQNLDGIFHSYTASDFSDGFTVLFSDILEYVEFLQNRAAYYEQRVDNQAASILELQGTIDYLKKIIEEKE